MRRRGRADRVLLKATGDAARVSRHPIIEAVSEAGGAWSRLGI